MEATTNGIGGVNRARAAAVLGAFAATLALGIVLTLAFDVDVQQADAAELATREDDARAFFVGDYLFILLYAIVSPIVIWRFGRPAWWAKGAAVLLPLAG